MDEKTKKSIKDKTDRIMIMNISFKDMKIARFFDKICLVNLSP